jgi:hypothetical protein
MYLEKSIYIIDFYHSKNFEGPNFLFRPRSKKPQDRPCRCMAKTETMRRKLDQTRRWNLQRHQTEETRRRRKRSKSSGERKREDRGKRMRRVRDSRSLQKRGAHERAGE